MFFVITYDKLIKDKDWESSHSRGGEKDALIKITWEFPFKSDEKDTTEREPVTLL